jgi:hypothetical protein
LIANSGEGANFLIRSYAQGTFRRATLVRGTCLGLAILLVLLTPSQGGAYAVLAHQAEIDVVWESHLKPLLHKKFSKATEDMVDGAEAYAYGGAIIQDLGYYPYGSRFFSNLAHYMRSGDFVTALLRDSQDVDEYAFALGALSHYASDIDGHRVAVNPSVPKLYPKLQKKYGDRVTYEDDPLAHVQTEFGFDVLQVARGRYASDEFHDFIGFEVSQRLLDQAFLETYGLPSSSVLLDEEKALNSYRRDVSKLIPKATRVAWSLKSKEIQAEEPNATQRKFLYNLSRADLEKQWEKTIASRPPASAFWRSCTNCCRNSARCGCYSCACRRRTPRSCSKPVSMHRWTDTGPCWWRRARDVCNCATPILMWERIRLRGSTD